MIFFEKRKIIILIFFLFFIAFLWFWFLETKEYKEIEIGSSKIKVELAISETDKIKGLSFRQNFGQSQGLLFVYAKPARPNFWMKQMNFPIDIIWIAQNQVIGFEKNLLPEGENPKKIYQPPNEIDFVLEVPAGFIEANNIKITDKFEIK